MDSRMLGLYFNQQFNWCCKKQLYSFCLAMFTANKYDLKVISPGQADDQNHPTFSLPVA